MDVSFLEVKIGLVILYLVFHFKLPKSEIQAIFFRFNERLPWNFGTMAF